MKLRVLFLSPGPKMSINEAYYAGLSEFCDGVVVSTSNEASVLARTHVASLGFRCTHYWPRSPMLSSLVYASYCLAYAIVLRISGNRFDLVSTYDPIKTGVIGAVAASILGARFAPEVNGVYTSEAEYMDSGASTVARLKKRLVPAVIRWVLSRADGIKLLFDSQIEPFSDVVRGKLVARFPAFVNISRFRNLGEDNEVLFVGFPYKRKGVDILIKAFKEIAPAHPNWKLKILGWFPDKTQLDSEIDGHPQIYHHPPVYYPEMPEHLGRCAFLVLPSRSEAMGRVLVEAMACGKPRVGSNIDGIPTVIDDGVDGILVEPESITALAAALELLISNDTARKAMGDAARHRAQSEFSEEAHFSNLKRFYIAVAAPKTP